MIWTAILLFKSLMNNDWTMTSRVTLPCEVYIFILESELACLDSVLVIMQGWHASGCRFTP